MVAIGCGIDAYIELKPEFKGILGVVGTGGLTEFVFPTLALLLLPVLPFPVLLLLLLLFELPFAPLTWSTERRCVRSFSSRLHFARRFENQTFFFLEMEGKFYCRNVFKWVSMNSTCIYEKVKECEKDTRTIGRLERNEQDRRRNPKMCLLKWETEDVHARKSSCECARRSRIFRRYV